MQKKLKNIGKNTLPIIEVQNVSQHGLWINLNEKEYFLSFKDFPWFLDAKISQIYNVIMLKDKHIHWPLLDIDITLDSLSHSAAYPLVYKK